MTAGIINIVSAKLTGEYHIDIIFDDGVERTVDFKPFLNRSMHPDIRTYLDPAKFAKFRLEFGELVWGDYELCFPIIDLYKGRLERNVEVDAAA